VKISILRSAGSGRLQPFLPGWTLKAKDWGRMAVEFDFDQQELITTSSLDQEAG
jgi:hypothetical protein